MKAYLHLLLTFSLFSSGLLQILAQSNEKESMYFNNKVKVKGNAVVSEKSIIINAEQNSDLNQQYVEIEPGFIIENGGYINIEVNTKDFSLIINKSPKANEDNLPMEYFLFYNYPNPFNPSTLIGYSIKEDVYVSLKIYDVLGKEVKTLVNEYQTAGYKSVLWYGTNNSGTVVSSGLYFYKIVAGDFVDFKRMVIIK